MSLFAFFAYGCACLLFVWVAVVVSLLVRNTRGLETSRDLLVADCRRRRLAAFIETHEARP